MSQGKYRSASTGDAWPLHPPPKSSPSPIVGAERGNGGCEDAGTAPGKHRGAAVCAAEPWLALPSLQSRWHGAWRRLGRAARERGRPWAGSWDASLPGQGWLPALRQAAANGHRSGCFQQRLAAVGVCRSPLLSCAEFGTYWHESLALPPPCHLCVGALVLSPHQCFKDEPFQNAWGSQHHFLPHLLPPYLGVSTLPCGPLHHLERWSSIPYPKHVTSPGCSWPPQAEPMKEG